MDMDRVTVMDYRLELGRRGNLFTIFTDGPMVCKVSISREEYCSCSQVN